MARGQRGGGAKKKNKLKIKNPIKAIGDQINKVKAKVKKAGETKKAVKAIDKRISEKSGSDGRSRAQRMALERKKAKLKGTYKKPKTAQELAKERIKAREEAKKVKKTSRGKQRR